MEKKKVLIFCAGGYGKRVKYALDEDRYEVVGYLDNNSKKWGASCAGARIMPPTMLLGNELEYDYIIISLPDYEEEIKQILIERYGIDAGKILTYDAFYKGVCWREEREIALLMCIEQIKERNITGSMAELGVYKGDFSKLFNLYLPKKKLYLFDTFEGFNTDRDVIWPGEEKRFKDTSVDVVLEKMCNPKNCIVRKGYFPDTAVGIEDYFCLVSLDADLYEPTIAGLNFFYPRLVPGGYIFVHDFGLWRYPGVKKAVYEFCNSHHINFVPLPDRCESVIIAK